MGTLLLNSKGLNTKTGTEIIYRELLKIVPEGLSNKTLYAVSLPEYDVDEAIIDNCTGIMGMDRTQIHLSSEGLPKDYIPGFIYVTEGNTFEVLQYMRVQGIVDYIREQFVNNPGMIYIGSSAGAMISGKDIMLAADFDPNYTGMIDLTALGLFEGTIIPHYEPEQLKMYLECTEEHILRRYDKIYSVGDKEAVVIKQISGRTIALFEENGEGRKIWAERENIKE